MTIQQINPASIAVYLSPEDLETHGYQADELTVQQALHLMRTACRKLGFVPAGIVEIEAFPGACGVLVFARLHAQPPALFRFPDLETLLSAIPSLPTPYPSAALTYWDHAYYLSFPTQNPSYHSILSEFGKPLQATDTLIAYLNEHGQCIAKQEALEQLQTAFCRCGSNT